MLELTWIFSCSNHRVQARCPGHTHQLSGQYVNNMCYLLDISERQECVVAFMVI